MGPDTTDMQANSLLGCARAIDGLLEDLLGLRRLAGRRDPPAHAAAIRATLDDVVAMLSAVAPAPTWHDHNRGEDAVLGALLRGLYDDGAASVERLAARLDGGAAAIADLAGTGRVERVEGYVLVPLSGPHAGDNWRVVLEVLGDVLTGIHRKARRVRRRIGADGGSEVGTFDRVADRLRVLAESLDRLGSHARYVGRLSAQDTRLLRSLRRLLDRYHS